MCAAAAIATMPAMTRSPLLVAVTATALLSVPAIASASGSTVVAGPLKAKGYSITLTATDAAAGDTFGIDATKVGGGSTQMHAWSFGSAVKVSVKGGKATIKGSLGRYGRIDAVVDAGPAAKGSVPKGCTGSGATTRSGRLTGTARLALDTTFFKTLAPKALKAQILTGSTISCGAQQPAAAGAKGLMLSVPGDGAPGSTMVTVARSGGKVTQMVMNTEDGAATAPASVFHMILAQTGAPGLDAAPDLSTAHAPAAGPFLSGTLSFAGEPAGATMATGTVSGDFTAKFDVIGPFRPAAGATAMLMQQ
ncbi:MAG: hypothetical protein JWR63_3122 [Conexibacter sp.]|nr:hypothetical protein [Conexibacter sp.]